MLLLLFWDVYHSTKTSAVWGLLSITPGVQSPGFYSFISFKSLVSLLPVTSASQPHFFHVCRAISNHSHHINGSKITACEYFSDIFQMIKEIKQVCDAVFTRSDDIRGLVWRWGGPDGPVLPWKCQGLFLLASPAFTCIIHPSSNVSWHFKRRKVLTEKRVQAWADHAEVALEGWSRITHYTPPS